MAFYMILYGGFIIMNKNGDKGVKPYHLQTHIENYEEKRTNEVMTILQMFSPVAQDSLGEKRLETTGE